MEIVSEKNEMIFRKDYNGKPSYSIGLSRKQSDGTYLNGYMKVSFKKDVELKNKSRIRINQAWLDFYKADGKTIPYIFINDYTLTQDGESDTQNVEVDTPNPFEDFGNSIKTEVQEAIEIKDSDLPF
jgi:hypothetical protein